MQGFRKKTAAGKWALLLLVATGMLLIWRLIGSSLLLRLSSSVPPGSTMLDMEPKWARKTDSLNIRAEILEQLRMNGTSPCHNVRTYGAEVLMVSPPRSSKNKDSSIHHLDIGSRFDFMLVSVTENGTARCAGGDYYELELVGEHWRSRPTITDHGNGSYSVTLVMDGWEFPGVYNFTAYLLFDNFHGLDEDPGPWVVKKEVVRMQFGFAGGRRGGSSGSSLPVCKADDMMRGGRWTRGWYNETCEADKEGRYKCLGEDHERCEGEWCEGRVSRLESNGWVYSKERCKFRLWEEEEAWNCLNGKWMVFSGDSNMQDMVRNLLLFVLDYPPPTGATITDWYIDPSVERFYINPRKPDQALQVSIVSNHLQYNNLDHGNSLHNQTYQNWLRLHFNGSTSTSSTFPHFLILNPGLDDGQHSLSVKQFISHLDTTFQFWHSLLQSLPPGHHGLPSIVLRTAVTPAGDSRGKQSNPHKMEVFNSLTVERLKNMGGHDLVVIDAFDPTFPFHFDYGCSDGGHYGRSPKYTAWPWLGEPHQYFVEIMLIHMMLNAICDE